MTRDRWTPQDFGIESDKEQLVDLFVDEFNTAYHGTWTIEELTFHPRAAMQFCDEIRRKHHFFDLPDDIVLRSIVSRRKNPN